LSLFCHSVIKITIILRLSGIHWFFKWVIFNILRNGHRRNWYSFCYWYWRLSLFLRLCIISIGKSSKSIWLNLTRLLKWIIDNKLFRSIWLLIIIRHNKSFIIFFVIVCIIGFYNIIKIVALKVIHIYCLWRIIIHLICLLILCFFHKWIYYSISLLHFFIYLNFEINFI
jgi:hypothetical protein